MKREQWPCLDLPIHTDIYFFSALTLVVRRQESHPACKTSTTILRTFCGDSAGDDDNEKIGGLCQSRMYLYKLHSRNVK